MNKPLLLIACTALVANTLGAVQYPDPQIIPGLHLTAMSPNGEYAAGENQYHNEINVYDVRNIRYEVFQGLHSYDYYTLGVGANSVSNIGITLMSTTWNGMGCYIENGKIKPLPIPEDYDYSLANAITPDGLRIAGMLLNDMDVYASEVMSIPVIWNRNEADKYDDQIRLPYPETDIFGNTPQYILIDGISADGKTLAGQVVDYFGMILMPIVYTENEHGEWTYRLLGMEYINPNGIELPESPGAEPNPDDYMGQESIDAYQAALDKAATLEEPDPADYMSEESYAAYIEALKEDPSASAYHFMTDEERAAFDAAIEQYFAELYPNPITFLSDDELAAYYEDYLAWNEKKETFYEVIGSILESGKSFDMNILCLSQSGRYYAASVAYGKEVEKEYTDPATGATYTYMDYMSVQSTVLFDLEEGTSVLIENDVDSFIPTYVTDDGVVLGCKYDYPLLTNPVPYIALTPNEVMPLVDYVRSINVELYEWMHEQMYHKIIEWDWVAQDYVEVENWVLGPTTCNADMSAICMWVDAWESDDFYPYYSYIMPLYQSTGVDRVDAEEAQLSVAIDADGVITITGLADCLDVYSLDGRLVFHADNPESAVATSLSHGVYIVKATAAATTAVAKGII